jgi:metal-responsive CopG/Arc/MetJ family transcriptional regulator
MSMAKFKIKAPKALRGRLEDVAKKHGFASEAALTEHFITRGLKAYGATEGNVDAQIDQVVEDQGYSSADELIEHLLLRGLRAYEEAEDDPAKLEERLRGLGYID